MSAFGSGVKRTSLTQDTHANILTDIEHEIELASETVADVRYPHQQFVLKQAITQVRWLVGEIELRGEQAAARRLNLDVIVPCAAGIELRHDGAKAKSAVEPGGDMATISETDIVVFALVISMPEIDHRAAKRATASRQHKARKFERTAPSAGLAEVTALRRSWLEKRPLSLTDGRFIAIATGRCRRKFLRQDSVRTGKLQSGGKDAGVEQKSAASRFR
jgi:hypothetical protein